MAWDYLLWQLADRTNQAVFEPIKQDFEQQLRDSDDAVAAIIAQQQSLWQWQRVYEQSQLSALKFKPAADADRNDSPQLQAVFCIDVRSDRYRRALAQAGRVHGMTVNSKGFTAFSGCHWDASRATSKYRMYRGCYSQAFLSVSNARINRLKTCCRARLTVRLLCLPA